MSRPVNPLDVFHSYSYHFILLISENTESIRKVVSDNIFSSVSGVKLGEPLVGSTDVFLLSDSRKTSEFSIDSVSFDMYIAGTEGPADANSFSSAVNMRITDPSGIGFFNYFRYLMVDKFKSSFEGLVFYLHVSFIGQDVSGTPYHQSDFGLPLIMASTFNLAELGSVGGIYDLGFAVGNFGGAKVIPTLNMLNERCSVVAKEGLLGNLIQSFENQLNIKARDWFKTNNPSIIKSDGSQSKRITGEDQKTGKLVQYMITIPDNWFYFKVAGTGENAVETNWKNKQDETKTQTQVGGNPGSSSGDSNNTYIALPGDIDIEGALNLIFKSCPEVMALANKEAKNSGMVKHFKTLSSITSDSNSLLAHYDVVEYLIPDPKREAQVQERKDANGVFSSVQTNGRFDKKLVTEFDYIFSGKNSDIIDFHITVNNLLLGINTQPKVGHEVAESFDTRPQTRVQKNSSPGEKTPYGEIAKNQPMIPPPRTSEQKLNFGSMRYNGQSLSAANADAQEFQKSLSDLHAASLVSMTFKIRGNPSFFASYFINGVSEHSTLGGSVKDFVNISPSNFDKETSWEYDTTKKSKPKSKGTSNIIDAHINHRKFIETIKSPNDDSGTPGSFVNSATFVKVNIFGPADAPFSLDTSGNFKQQLFYDQHYGVMKVISNFERGSFTQELHVSSLEMYG